MIVSVPHDYVLLGDGKQVPITNWFDGNGDECEKPDAVVIVAGTEAAGFHVIDLRDLDRVTEH